MHFHKFLGNGSVDFLFLCVKMILLKSSKIWSYPFYPQSWIVHVNQETMDYGTFSLSKDTNSK